MDDRDVIDIGLHVIKRCGMYAEEYKNLISWKNTVPPIVETINSFKEYYWADAMVGNSDFWFQFLGPPLEAEFRFCF
jgi:hypothetical protein